MRVLGYEFLLALRRLVRRRTSTTLMLATFFVSIVLTALSWSMFHTIYLKQPGFDPQGEIYIVGQTGPNAPRRIVGYSYMTAGTREDVRAWQAQQTVFSETAPTALYYSGFINTDQGLERFLGANMSAAAFPMVGGRPLLGRIFTADEDEPGGAPVIILSENLWRTRFGGAEDIIGRSIELDGNPVTVVGVMPASFRFPNDQQFWLPQGMLAFERGQDRPLHDLLVRLKPGISKERAIEDLHMITQRRGEDTLAARYDMRPDLQPLREYYLIPELQRSVMVLFALALVFALVSCANAANIAMIEFFGRKWELASTLALGLPRAAAARGLFFQMLVPALIATAAALVVVALLSPHLHQLMILSNAPYWLTFEFSWHHVAVALGVAIGSVVVALIVPVVYLAWVGSDQIIRHGAGSGRGTSRSPWRRTLLAGQIALLTMLAVAAGLLVRSSTQLGEEHWGFEAGSILAGKTGSRRADYADDASLHRAHMRVLNELERQPGVRAAALMTTALGFSITPGSHYATTAEGLADGRSEGVASWSAVTPGIFDVLDTPFVDGENFLRSETLDRPAEAVINQSLAEKLWPGQSAVGRTIYSRSKTGTEIYPYTVRGVVRDFQASGPKSPINDAIYAVFSGWFQHSLHIYVRGEQTLPSAPAVLRTIQRTEPGMTLFFPKSLQGVIDTELNMVRLTTQLTTLYALAAVMLSAIGIYTLTASEILQRNREFGIRLALGIEPTRLWTRFTRTHLLTAAVGVALGLVGAVVVGRGLQSLLFGVKAHDLLTFTGVSLAIMVVSFGACLPSLFRLRRINPADCLRSL